jgi:hypothetical protein
MGTQLSGSKLPIARYCRWSFRDDVSYPPEIRSDEAKDGVRRHDAFANFVDTGVFPPMKGEDKIFADNLNEWWNKENRRQYGFKAERSYALDAASNKSRCLGTDLNRNYGHLEAGEIPLTVDYDGIENGLYVVGDFKTGWGAHVEDPEDNLQLLAGACAGSMHFDSCGGLKALGARIEILHVKEDGIYPRIYIASPFALMEACTEIAKIQASITGSEATPGDHCSFCAARGACPATRELVEAAAATRQFPFERRAEWTTEDRGPENDALLVDEISALKKALDAVEDALKARWAGKSLPLRDGKYYKLIVSKRQTFNRDLAAELLGDKFLQCTDFIEVESFRRVKNP